MRARVKVLENQLAESNARCASLEANLAASNIMSMSDVSDASQGSTLSDVRAELASTAARCAALEGELGSMIAAAAIKDATAECLHELDIASLVTSVDVTTEAYESSEQELEVDDVEEDSDDAHFDSRNSALIFGDAASVESKFEAASISSGWVNADGTSATPSPIPDDDGDGGEDGDEGEDGADYAPATPASCASATTRQDESWGSWSVSAQDVHGQRKWACAVGTRHAAVTGQRGTAQRSAAERPAPCMPTAYHNLREPHGHQPPSSSHAVYSGYVVTHAARCSAPAHHRLGKSDGRQPSPGCHPRDRTYSTSSHHHRGGAKVVTTCQAAVGGFYRARHTNHNPL